MLKHIILNLARNPDFPDGSQACGYDIVAPLDSSGHLDADAWDKHRAECHVRRFWTGEDDRSGFLVHKPGGFHGATWKIDYDPNAEDEEGGFRLDTHRFVPGEYVSIRTQDGHSHTFAIKEIHPA